MAKKNELKVVRLVNGELLMGIVVFDPNDNIFVKIQKVMGLAELPPKAEGEVGQLAMFPYMPYTMAQDEMEVPITAIASLTVPQKGIAQKHTMAFSKVLLPDQKTIGDIIGSADNRIIDAANKERG